MHVPEFRPLNVPPDEHVGEHRYVHVIGSAIFVDDRPAEVHWPTHFIGMVDGARLVGGRRAAR